MPRSRSDLPMVDVQIAGATGVLVLNNPSRHNAMTLGMWSQMSELVGQLNRDPLISCIVVRGAGRAAFSSGADVSEFESVRNTQQTAREYMAAVESAETALLRCNKMTIAMVHGICVGGGTTIALACSVRFSDTNLQFAIPAAKLGVVYPYASISRLVQICGPGVAIDILASGRSLGSAEALQFGLVNRVSDPHELQIHTHKYASAIAARAPLSVRGALIGVRAALNPNDVSLQHELQALESAAVQSDDYKEAIAAFGQKRKPAFRGS